MQSGTVLPGSSALQETKPNYLLWLNRLLILLMGLMIFLPQFNPGRISLKINENASLFTTAISYNTLTNSMGRALRMEWILPSHFHWLMAGAAIMLIGIVLTSAGGCMSLGNSRMKRMGSILPMIGSLLVGAGLLVIHYVYTLVAGLEKASRIDPNYPNGIYIFAVIAGMIFLLSLISFITRPKQIEPKMQMQEKFRLFLMVLPVMLLTLIFCYLPIYGWRFAFFDYQIGDALTLENFVGLKWFSYLFQTEATRSDLIRVMKNTMIMSGLGIATSWLPLLFAIMLSELRSTKFQRTIQTLTTIPNFISWVLVYAIAFCHLLNRRLHQRAAAQCVRRCRRE